MLSTDYKKLIGAAFKLKKEGSIFSRSERSIINMIFWDAATTQRQIMDATGIPQQTVSRMIKALIDEGCLLQTDRKPDGNRGPRSSALVLQPEFAYCFGISIRVNSYSVALMAFNGDVRCSINQQLEDMSVSNVLNSIQQTISDIARKQNIDQEHIFGVGLGISGYFLDKGGKINTMLDEWATIDIAKVVSEFLQLPVWVENDAKAAAAGEGIAGVGRQYSDFVYLFIATGFGGGVIVNREILRGAHGNAGELAEMLPPKIFLHPNLELLRQIVNKNEEYLDTVSDLVDNFDISWPGVNEWIFKIKDSLSIVASSSAALFDTQAIILGGRLPKSLANKLIGQIDIYARNRRSLPRSLPKLVAATTQGDPVAIGAASLPMRACFL